MNHLHSSVSEMVHLCHHGVPAVAVPITNADAGQRRLFRCSFPQATRCDFFQVDDDPIPRNNTGNAMNSVNISDKTKPSIPQHLTSSNGPAHQQQNSAKHNAHNSPDNSDAPDCRCGLPAVSRVVRKPGPNQNRHFYVCSKPRDQQCKFFDWANGSNVAQSARPVTDNQFLRAPADVGPTHSLTLNPPTLGASAIPNTHHNYFHPDEPLTKRPRVEQQQQLLYLQDSLQPQYQPQPQLQHHPPQQQRQAISLNVTLSSVENVSIALRPTLPSDLKDAARKFDGATFPKSGTFGESHVKIPVDKVSAFESFMKAQVSTALSFEFDVPRTTIERIAMFHEREKQREQAGDVVTRPLDEILPTAMCESLMEFQWDGVHFALKRGGRCLIGDDMGLGKTIQAIAIARVYIDDWPLLIVCPSSLRLNWREEILRWLESDLCEDDILVFMSGKDTNKTLRKVNIVSYDLVRKVPLHNLKRCQCVIADESHYLKSVSAQRTKIVAPLVRDARRALLLSGTPALSRPVELFAQVNAICPILFPSYNEYVVRYCNARQTFWGFDVSGSSHLDELHMILCGTLLIRRKKEEVLTQLPEKVRQVTWVETKPSVTRLLAKKFEAFEGAKAAAGDASTPEEANALSLRVKGIQNEIYALTAEAKLNSIMEFCRDTAESGCKFIVFCHHSKVINTLHDFVENKLKLGLIRIDGSTPQGIRQSLCKEFQADDDKKRVALLSITAAGVGLTLTKASVVLFAELYWNPGSLLQAEDRAHRIGQRNCILVNYLLAKKTLDESMWRTVRRKLTVVGQSLTGRAGRMDAEEGDRNAVSKSSSEGTGTIIGASSGAGEKKRPGDIRSFFGSPEKGKKNALINDDLNLHSTKIFSGEDVDENESSVVVPLENDDVVIPPISTAYGDPGVEKKSDENCNWLHEMFPKDMESESKKPSRVGTPEQALIDSDYAMAKRLQAEWDAERSRSR